MALIIAILGFLMICNGSGGYYYGYSSPFVIIGALLLLLAFTRIRINSSIINWVASSAFVAYIVHCHECIFDPLYKSYISRWFGEDPSYVFLGKTIIFILFLFILSIHYCPKKFYHKVS